MTAATPEELVDKAARTFMGEAIRVRVCSPEHGCHFWRPEEVQEVRDALADLEKHPLACRGCGRTVAIWEYGVLRAIGQAGLADTLCRECVLK